MRISPVNKGFDYINKAVKQPCFLGSYDKIKKGFGWHLSKDELGLSQKISDVLNKTTKKDVIVVCPNEDEFKRIVQENVKDDDDCKLHGIWEVENAIHIPVKSVSALVLNKDWIQSRAIVVGDVKKYKNPFGVKKFDESCSLDNETIIKLKNGVKIKLLKPYEENAYDLKGIYNDKLISVEDRDNANKVLGEDIDNDNPNSIKAKWTYQNIAGLDSEIEFMKRKVLFPLLYPEAFLDNKNKGTILYGEPGCGKTLLALATVGEAKNKYGKKINCYKIDAMSLNSRYVGATEEKWREIFKQLVETQPSILIIDEADSVFATRSDAENAQHYNRTVTQLLTLIEDLEKQDDKVAIIATTNRLDSIDPAIKRSGRFGDVLEIKKPDKNACLEILNLYLEGKNIDESFDKESYVDMLHQGGLTGADIAFIVNSVRDRAYERLGFFEQMENGEFEKESLEGLKYTQEDFLLAYADWAKNHKTEKKLFKFLG